ncbi:sugar transferase [Celeribacter baekdonensis]|uniref:sugar transferase n=1 Tax=Celeribacter baekdonensis TaxID=875171 RepID=UPI003A92A201
MSDVTASLIYSSRPSRLGGRFKKPNYIEGPSLGLLYRVVVSILSAVSSFVLLWFLGALSGWEIHIWTLVISAFPAVILTYLGETVRSALFERMRISNDEFFEIEVKEKKVLVDNIELGLSSRDRTRKSTSGYADREMQPKGLYVRFGKRIFDLIFIVLVLPILLPTICLLAILIRMDGGPAFFTVQRIGRNGRRFKVFKLRTMHVDAEEHLRVLLEADPALGHHWQTFQTLPNDPRISRLGRFLRATSLDELPQIFNVMMGDMSIVGPRPLMPPLQTLYGMYADPNFTNVKPGISGLWQVQSSVDSSIETRAKADMEYASKCSFLFDLRIVFKTFVAVVSGLDVQ